ncbi:RNA polymerase sigma factor [Motilibacter rhizosphaerae]|nr:RNA polymerase sigma factor [Motilibacter rhizosphaerae]
MSAGRSSADEHRFRELHARTYPDLLRFVERRVPPADAEDVVATVFLTAWRRLPDVPAAHDDARPWLYGVARHALANHLRAGGRRADLDVRAAAHLPGDVPDHAEAAGSRVDLARAWSALDARDRETLALVAFDGLTADQAARVVGCRRSAFAMRLTRARRRLREALDAAPAPAPTPAGQEASR